MTDYKAARARVEAALKMADRYDAGGMSFGESDDGHLKFDDLRTILAGPPVTEDEVAQIVMEAIDNYENSAIPEPRDAQNHAADLAAKRLLALFHKEGR